MDAARPTIPPGRMSAEFANSTQLNADSSQPLYSLPTTSAQIPQSMYSLPPQYAAATSGVAQAPSQPRASQGFAPQGIPISSQQGAEWIPGVARPQLQQVTNPPVQTNNISYGPSYQMSYFKRSTADKSAIKYTGFLPLEGCHEDDTCRIG